MEANLSMITNSSPMLLPLYTWWKYRRVWGEGADDYVSRLRGGAEHGDEHPSPGRRAGARKRSVVENLVSGVPLETIYGVENVHFTATVVRGDKRDSIKMTTQKRRQKERRRPSKTTDDGGGGDEEDAASGSESTRRLSRNAQMTGHAGIQIETKWSITEETVK